MKILIDYRLDDILTVLQNKRLHFDLIQEDFDVESAKSFGDNNDNVVEVIMNEAEITAN